MNPSPRRRSIARPQVVRRLLSLFPNARYLEVGVCAAATFDKVDATIKVAVDPEFRFDHEAPHRARPGQSYHQVTSDHYFGSVVSSDQQFDVIFLDGLHTFEQTLRDLLNALHHLQPQGVILIDDVRPPTYLASLPDRESFFEVRSWLGVDDKAWMGDVYRLIYFMDTFMQQLTYRTISNNHGQAVVWRARRAEVTDRQLAAVGQISFEDFVLSEAVLHRSPFGKIVGELQADLGLSSQPDSLITPNE